MLAIYGYNFFVHLKLIHYKARCTKSNHDLPTLIQCIWLQLWNMTIKFKQILSCEILKMEKNWNTKLQNLSVSKWNTSGQNQSPAGVHGVAATCRRNCGHQWFYEFPGETVMSLANSCKHCRPRPQSERSINQWSCSWVTRRPLIGGFQPEAINIVDAILHLQLSPGLPRLLNGNLHIIWKNVVQDFRKAGW